MEYKPVNLNGLSSILAKAKNVMNVVENEKTPSTKKVMVEDYGHNSGYDYITENGETKDLLYNKPIQNLTYGDEDIINSKLPEAIKESLLKKKIPILSGPPSNLPNLDVEKINSLMSGKQKNPTSQVNLNENVIKQKSINITREEIQEMIDKSINKMIRETYEKNITEQTIKKTLNVLIKEGRLKR